MTIEDGWNDTPWHTEAQRLVDALPELDAMTLADFERIAELRVRLGKVMREQGTVAGELADELRQLPDGATFATHGTPEQIARARQYDAWSRDVEEAQGTLDWFTRLSGLDALTRIPEQRIDTCLGWPVERSGELEA